MLANEAISGSVAKANVSLDSSTGCSKVSTLGCRYLSSCLAPNRSMSVMASRRFGLCNFSANRLSNRNTDASCKPPWYNSSGVYRSHIEIQGHARIIKNYLFIRFACCIEYAPCKFGASAARLPTNLKVLDNWIKVNCHGSLVALMSLRVIMLLLLLVLLDILLLLLLIWLLLLLFGSSLNGVQYRTAAMCGRHLGQLWEHCLYTVNRLHSVG